MVLYNNSGRTGGRNKSLGVIEATNLYKSGARSETTRVFRAVAGSFKVKNIINSIFSQDISGNSKFRAGKR